MLRRKRSGVGSDAGSAPGPASPKHKILDRKLVYALNGSRIPTPRQLKHLPKVLPPKEQLLIRVAGLLVAAGLLLGVGNFYFRNFLPQPAVGGTYTEGLIGAPQYINPLLSQTSDVDTDLSRLLFSGLVRFDQQLEIVPDLAENWTVNEAKTEYLFTLRQGLRWHDNEPLTADDVIFTFRSIQDPSFRSPLLVSVRGVVVEKTEGGKIKFTLPDPYPQFLEVLTVGILPEHIWGTIPPVNANLTNFNLKPVGSGPWQFKSLAKDQLGNIRSITLIPFAGYPLSKPYLEKLVFKFYPDFQTAVGALKNHSVDGISFLPKELKTELVSQRGIELYSLNLPQYTSIFFNQRNNEALADKDIRTALAYAINKSEILTVALRLEGKIIDGPILPGSPGYDPQLEPTPNDPEQANTLLDDAGWARITPEEYEAILTAERDKEVAAAAVLAESEATTEETPGAVPPATTTPPAETAVEPALAEATQPFYRRKGETILSITLTTVNQPENTTAAELVKRYWEQIGVTVELEIVEGGKISREVIKPRRYQALLYGIILGSDPDPYPFWHSSQTQDPGLNLALYANRNVDSALELARQTESVETQHEKYTEFQKLVIADRPAIFLYSPTYTYAVSKRIKGITNGRILIPSDRLNALNRWYLKTKRTFQNDSKF